MHKRRNLYFATIGTIITFIVLGVCGALSIITGIIAVVFWFVPTLTSSDFNNR